MGESVFKITPMIYRNMRKNSELRLLFASRLSLATSKKSIMERGKFR